MRLVVTVATSASAKKLVTADGERSVSAMAMAVDDHDGYVPAGYEVVVRLEAEAFAGASDRLARQQVDDGYATIRFSSM